GRQIEAEVDDTAVAQHQALAAVVVARDAVVSAIARRDVAGDELHAVEARAAHAASIDSFVRVTQHVAGAGHVAVVDEARHAEAQVAVDLLAGAVARAPLQEPDAFV